MKDNLTEVERRMLEIHEQRENRARESWFATKQYDGKDPVIPNFRTAREYTRELMRDTDEPEYTSIAAAQDLERIGNGHEKRGKRQSDRSVYYFVLNHFQELDKLIPEDPDMDDETRSTMVNEILKKFRDMGHVPDEQGDLVAWKIIEKIFSSRYQELKRDKGIV